MLFDTHMHCCFSGDSEALPEDMIRAAREKNLAGLCFTDHLDIDYPDYPELFLLDFQAYYDKIRALRASLGGPDSALGGPDSALGGPDSAGQKGFTLLWGIEIGLQPYLAQRHNEIIHSWPFDFVIGSSHLCHGHDPYYPSFFEGRTEEVAYREYFESVLENILCDVDFDVYGHIDYVVRYGPNQNRFYSYAKYADVIDEILRQLIDRGKGIEINTGGFKYGLGHPNPTEDIIRRYRELGGEIITIGADAHKPEHVAYDFEKVPSILKAAGFDYFTIFRQRKAEFIRL